MLSSLFVLGPTGHTVFEKHWQEVVSRRALDELWTILQREGGAVNAPPMHAVGRIAMVHVSRGALLFVGTVARDVPALVVIELLHRVGDLLELYLKELSEQSMRANFVTVYQLLDEVIDNGAPLHTEPNVLQELVMQPGKMEAMMASVTGASHVRGALPESTTSLAPWRRTSVRYAASEFYIDLNERLDVTVSDESLRPRPAPKSLHGVLPINVLCLHSLCRLRWPESSLFAHSLLISPSHESSDRRAQWAPAAR